MNDIQATALSNARNGDSFANYPAIIEGFAAKGIPVDQITPRVNVFSYNAWLALGRQVRKGEHGVKVCTWVPMTKKSDAGVSEDIGRKPRAVTVFHVSQTDEVTA